MSKNNDVLSTSYTSIKIYEDNKTVFTLSEFTQFAEITEDRVKELLELGWLQPVNSEPINSNNDLQFKYIDAYKARKVDRLCCDFEFPSLAGAIIVDLLEKIDDLEAKLKKI